MTDTRQQAIWLKEGHRWEPNWPPISAALQIVPSPLLLCAPIIMSPANAHQVYTFLYFPANVLPPIVCWICARPSVNDKCFLQVSRGVSENPGFSNLASWLSVCTTTSVGFIQALWLLPQSEDSNTGLNRDYECIEFLGNGAFACHVLVTWCVDAFPRCWLDSCVGLFTSISCHLLLNY